MKKLFALTTLIVHVLFVFAQKKNEIIYDPNKTFTPAQLKEDVVFLRKCLVEAHPSLYRYTSKDSLDKTFDVFEQSLTQDLTERAFRNQLFPVVNEIKCGHSNLLSSKARQSFLKTQKTKYPPFNLSAIGNQLFIKENKSNDSTLRIGTEVLSIEGQKSQNMIQALGASFARDGYNQTFPDYYLLNGFSQYYPRLFEEKDTFLLVVKDKNGTVRSVKTPCVNTALTTPFRTIAKGNKAIFTYNKTSYFALDSENPAIAILKIKGFGTFGFWKFYRKTFKSIKKNKVENLVLDLRDNGGGLVFNAGRLLSYLIAKPLTISMYRNGGKPTFLPQTVQKDKEYKQTYNLFPKMRKKWGVSTTKNDTFYKIDYTNKVKKNSYKGNLFVLTNGLTFSASGIVSAYLRNEKRATFIGIETGGCEEGSNGFNVPTLILPNTKLLYTLPLFRLDHEGVNVAKKGHGIFPDYPMQYSVEDYLTNRDLEMEKVRTLVKK